MIKTTDRSLSKLCQICGKQESYNWVRHWKTWHEDIKKEDRAILAEDDEPQQPWCSNWRDVIDGTTPKDILPQYLKFYRCANKRHKAGQSEATPSVDGEFGELKEYHVPTQENTKKLQR